MPCSRPFMHRTKILSRRDRGFSWSMRPWSPWEPMEITTVSACRTQARSVDRAMDSGRVSRSFCRVARNRCMCREPGRPYSVTRWPVRSRYQAISEPQRPHPITVICIKIPPVA